MERTTMDFSNEVETVHETGILNLAYKEMTATDFLELARCLFSLAHNHSDHREYRPRKCRRLEGVPALLSSLSKMKGGSSPKIWKLHLEGNRDITLGGVFLQCLQHLPDSIIDVDLSNCNLSLQEIMAVCNHVGSNTSIKRLVMSGNPGVKMGSWFPMLARNNALEELDIAPHSVEFDSFELIDIAMGIYGNTKLRVLTLSHGRRYIWSSASWAFALAFQTNRTLERIEFGNIFGESEYDLNSWEEALKDNTTLKSVGSCQGLRHPARLDYYLELNSVGARDVTATTNPGFINAIIKASDYSRTRGVSNNRGLRGLNAMYYLLSQSPGLIPPS